MSAKAKKAQESTGSPPWMATFADLMSLLMCFFVLLLSFSEMDLQKYKQVSGSMKEAFGVQREVKTMEMPKGTSIIAKEFTPGRPSPTVMKIVRQDSIDEARQTLSFTDSMTEKKDAEDFDEGETGQRATQVAIQRQTGADLAKESLDGGNDREIMEESKVRDIIESEGAMEEIAKFLEENKLQQMEKITKEELEKLLKLIQALLKKQEVELSAADAEKLIKALQASAQQKLEEQTKADAEQLALALKKEIQRGMIQVESEGKKILVRIREKGSFPSGSATFKPNFLPVLAKLRKTLSKMSGNVLVAGHTDNIPIKTERFRSNWELSASRSVSVVHELLIDGNIDPGRFLVEGYGESRPIAPNDTWENRALNRRVELTIVQGNEGDDISEKAFEEIVNNALTSQLEVDEIQPEPPENPFDRQNEGGEETAAVGNNTDAIPDVSIDILKESKQTPVPVEETVEEEPVVENTVQPEVPTNTESSKLKFKDIQERIRNFSRKMEKHKK